MLEKSETNEFIRYFGNFVLIGSIIAMVLLIFIGDGFLGWMIGIGVAVAGAFNALLLYAISEVLSRLQMIEHNTRRNHKNDEDLEI